MKLVADNIRITKKEIQNALDQRNPGPIQALARQCVKAGAQAIDINTGPLGREADQKMAFFVQAVESVSALPLLIDTANASAMAAGLKAAKNRTIINSISLEPRKLEKILPLAAEYGCDLVGFLLHPDSRVPKDQDEQFAIALELVAKLEAAGVDKGRLIIDPVVPPLVWDEGLSRSRQVIDTIGLLPDLLGFPVQTIAGLSNLTTGALDKSKKSLVEGAYLCLLAQAGLDYLMLDVLDTHLVDSARAASLLTREEIFSWELV